MKLVGLLSGDMCTDIVLGLYILFPHLNVFVSPLSRDVIVNGYHIARISPREEADRESKVVVGRCAAIIQGAIDRNRPRKNRRR